MWWKWVLKAAIALGFDDWAEKKAIELAVMLKVRVEKRVDQVLAAVSKKVEPEGVTIIRRDRDDLRPGSVIVQNDVSYRVVRLVKANSLGAFYEARAE